SRRRHTRSKRDWSSDVCSSDLGHFPNPLAIAKHGVVRPRWRTFLGHPEWNQLFGRAGLLCLQQRVVPDEIRFGEIDEKSETRLRSEERRVGKECRSRSTKYREK